VISEVAPGHRGGGIRRVHPAAGPEPGRVPPHRSTDAPDGACHFLDTNDRLVGHPVRDTRGSGSRRPTPAVAQQFGEPVDDVLCQRGHFVLIRTAGGQGWVASSDIRTIAFRGSVARSIRFRALVPLRRG
jgi:hypothetical protein